MFFLLHWFYCNLVHSIQSGTRSTGTTFTFVYTLDRAPATKYSASPVCTSFQLRSSATAAPNKGDNLLLPGLKPTMPGLRDP